MNNPKTLIIGEYLSGRGGTEKVLQDFYHEFKNTLEIHFLFLNSNELEKEWLKDITNYQYFDAGNFVKNLRANNIFFRLLLQSYSKKTYKKYIIYRNIEAIVKKIKPKVIITTSFLYLSIIKKIIKLYDIDCKIIFWDHMAHSFYLKDTNQFKKNIFNSDYYFAISSGIKNSLTEIGISKEKIFLIFNPIKRQSTNKFSTRKIKFIYVGRLMVEKQKRCMDILYAANKLKNLDFTIEFYGDGEERHLLESQTINMNLEDKIHYKGWHTKPWDQIEEASCLLLSSEYEGFGLVIAEAISYGIPCISSKCKYGPEDIIKPHISGNFFQSGNVDQLANLMKEFILQPENFIDREIIKDSISEFYSENYFANMKKIINKIIE